MRVAMVKRLTTLVQATTLPGIVVARCSSQLVALASMLVAVANSPWSWQPAGAEQLASVGESQGWLRIV